MATKTKLRRSGASTQAMTALVAMARTGSVAAAARSCGITEQSIREQLKTIEAGFGPGLITRTKGRLGLTAMGVRTARVCEMCLIALNEEITSCGNKALPFPVFAPVSADGAVGVPAASTAIPSLTISPPSSSPAQLPAQQPAGQGRALVAACTPVTSISGATKALPAPSSPATVSSPILGSKTSAHPTAIAVPLPVQFAPDLHRQLSGSSFLNDSTLTHLPAAQALLSVLKLRLDGDGSLAGPCPVTDFKLAWRLAGQKPSLRNEDAIRTISIASAHFDTLLVKRGHPLANASVISKASLRGLRIWVSVHPGGQLGNALWKVLRACQAEIVPRDWIDDDTPVDAVLVPGLVTVGRAGWVAKAVKGVSVAARLDLVAAPELIFDERSAAVRRSATKLPGSPRQRIIDADTFASFAKVISAAV